MPRVPVSKPSGNRRAPVGLASSILILTDRPQGLPRCLAQLVERIPSVVQDCSSPRLERTKSTAIFISDLSLKSAGNVERLRTILKTSRSETTPLICLVDGVTHQARAQAFALSANRVISVDKPCEYLIAAVSALLPNDTFSECTAFGVDEQYSIERFVRRAYLALSDIMDDCRAEKPISRPAIMEGTDAVLHATEHVRIREWLRVVETYDNRTHQHCLVVAGLVASFGKFLGFRKSDRRRLTSAALLHDIGKARIPLSILNKPGRLTDAEMGQMRTHAPIGYDLLVEQGGFDEELLSIVRHHHEYLDGSGYPDVLSAPQLSDPIRITTICDIFAALIERRAYKAPMSFDQAYGVMLDMGGKLDRDLLREFSAMLRACKAE